MSSSLDSPQQSTRDDQDDEDEGVTNENATDADPRRDDPGIERRQQGRQAEQHGSRPGHPEGEQGERTLWQRLFHDIEELL